MRDLDCYARQSSQASPQVTGTVGPLASHCETGATRSSHRLVNAGLVCLVMLVLSRNLPLAAAEDGPFLLGKSVAPFSLIDYRGKAHSLDDYQSSPVLVLAVLGTECPLAKQYSLKLQKLAESYAGQGVTFLGIDANRQDSLTEIAAFARTNGLTYPILKDLNQEVVDDLQATRTPEVFVLDAKRVVRYRGRVDDQYSVGGKSRPAPTREDLKLAIDEVLAGTPVSVTETTAVGCLIGRSRPVKTGTADSAVTYSNQIARLLQKHCVECHRPGEIAPFSLTDYHEVAGWADMILEVTQTGQMPPWHASPEHGHFANERRLTPEELSLLQQWVAAGSPEGDPAELPPPPTYTEGWQLPRQPDHVVWMSETPFTVPAEGTVDYQYFSVDPGLTEDKWITGAEIIPGSRAVVHHVIVFISTDGEVRDGDRQMLTAFVPGLRVGEYPQGMAKRIPAGAKFIFQMHYTPNGVAREDRTQIGLLFADPAEVTHEIRTVSTVNTKFKIQPELDNQAFSSSVVTAPQDLQLLSLSPHMHLRGKSFRYELTHNDGTKEVLLDVPHYDFNWQTAYKLIEPRLIPRGSKIQSFAAFDNSARNLANPDPSKTVKWGEQSWDEMLLGYFDVAVPRESELLKESSSEKN
ncbi:redoxin domain-containing protein [Schlesneria sp. T3-172]|uniref:redoxin domain-containing protein n=1 Tax=Schlesneria sphaerica TaxID=3373610 RepID=UPI0037C6C564